MTVVGRSSSAVMLDPVTVYIFAATLPIPCVVSVLPVPGRAGKLRAALVDRRCWFSATGAIFWKRVRLPMAAGPGGAVDTQEPSAEGAPLSSLFPKQSSLPRTLRILRKNFQCFMQSSWPVGRAPVFGQPAAMPVPNNF